MDILQKAKRNDIDDAMETEPVETVENPKRKLDSASDDFYKRLQAKKVKSTSTASNMEKQLAAEISTYDRTNYKGPLLLQVLQVTKTLRPTSCDCERIFSVAGYYCNKLRSNLSDDTLSSLCMLKFYFNHHFKRH